MQASASSKIARHIRINFWIHPSPTKAGNKAYLYPMLHLKQVDEATAWYFDTHPVPVLQLKANFEKIQVDKKVEALMGAEANVMKQTLEVLKNNNQNSQVLKALWKTPGKSLKTAFEESNLTPPIRLLREGFSNIFPWSPFSDTDWIGGVFTTPWTNDKAEEGDTESTQEDIIKNLLKGLGIASKVMNFLESDLDDLQVLLGSSSTKILDLIGVDQGVDPEALGKLTLWEGIEHVKSIFAD